MIFAAPFFASLGSVITVAFWWVITRLLISLGVGLVVFTGLMTGFNAVIDEIDILIGELPAALVALLSLSGVGVAISIVISAVTIRLTLMGLFPKLRL